MGALSLWRQRRRQRLRLAFALLVVIAVPSCSYLQTQPQAAVANPELAELSGLSRSLATDDWLWGHNDSGDRARLFRIGLDGSDGGVVEVPEANAIDWEDITALRWQGEPALLIGDIGDNNANRAAVTLYAVRDPGATGKVAGLLWQLNFRYPDGPRDAEGLAVDPLSGDILILSKRESPPVIYQLAMPTLAPPAGEIANATRLGPVLHIPKPTLADIADDPKFGWLRDWPTALAIAPDGLSAIVTTYKNAYRYHRHSPDENWAIVFTRKPVTIRLPQWRQTEAGDYTNDGLHFCAGSEQRAGFACIPLMNNSYSSSSGTKP